MDQGHRRPDRLTPGCNTILQPNLLHYAATEDLAIFAILPYLFIKRKFPYLETGKRINQKQNGLDDLNQITGYKVFNKHIRSGNIKLAPVLGIVLPTEDENLKPITTGSYNFEFGAVATATLNHKRHKFVADAVYRVNTEHDIFEKGDSITYNASFHHRIFPWSVPPGGLKNWVHFVFESNGFFSKKKSIKGITDKNSRGHILFVAPGIQAKVSRFVFESSFQIPALQDLNGNQIEADFAWTFGIIVNILE